MTHVDHPFAIGPRGRTATTTDAAHLRDLVEQVLLTAPGERVNRPDFGTGLRQLVFAPNGPELAATTRALIQGALQQHLGDVIAVETVAVTATDTRLEIQVDYRPVAGGPPVRAEIVQDL